MSGDLWIWQLSITTTELGAGNGSIRLRRRLMKRWKVTAQNEPSTTSQCMMPSLREIAGRTEKLGGVRKKWIWMNMFSPLPTHKKGLALCWHPTNRPCTPLICCLTINWALINENKLFSCVFTNSVDIVEPLFCWMFNCSMWQLCNDYMLATNVKWEC